MRQNRIVYPVVLFLLIFVVGIIIFPIYVTFVTAFKTTAESTENFFSLPSHLYLGNFITVMSDEHFWDYVRNSVGITVISIAIIAVMIPMVSYSIARNMMHKYYKFIFVFFILSVFTPFQVLMIPVTQLCTKLGLMNKAGMVLLYITFALGMGVFLFTGYYKSIPLELEEASFVEGCSVTQTFFKIVYPLAKPMTVTLIILNSLWIWNDFLLPLLILNKSAYNWTLPLYQYNFKGAYTFNYNLAFAAFLYSIVPMMILYAALQKNIIEGLTAGAVKA